MRTLIRRPAFALAILAIAANVRAQQLDHRCTVSILNRTAQVQADGTWEIFNVPANLGLQRARATCIQDGVTHVGVSELLFIPRGQAVGVGGINFITVPVPAKLSVTAPATLLPNIGDTLQLTTRATYPDGSVVDISSAAGTTYSTTNPAIATVSNSGLVRAVAGGNVIVSAMNDGAVGLLRLAVGSDLADSDGDGMTDVWERANGFDPNDPADAAGDADADGLTNLQEFQRATNPRQRDTDGDGVGDGLEVRIGTDPLDPGSIDLARALRRVDVTPNPAHLHINAYFPDVSLQLAVIGTLLDGATIDLTSQSRGTRYATDDPFIINFGPIDGRLYPGGSDGTCLITVTSNGFAIDVPTTVDTFNPGEIGSLDIPGYANNVKVAGGYAFIAAGAAGLQVVDVRDPAHPVIAASLALPGTAIDLRLRNGLAYVATGASGLAIVDIHNPLSPAIVGSVDTAGTAQDVWLDGNYAWIADGASGLVVIDITNPAAPAIVRVASLGNIRAVSVSGPYGVAVTQSGSLLILDTTNPLNLLAVGSTSSINARDVALRDRYAWVALSNGPGMLIADIFDPSAPTLAYMSNGSFFANDLVLFGQFAFMAEYQFSASVPFIDGANPAQPFFRQILNLDTAESWRGTGIDADARFIYSTRERFGVSGDFRDTGTTRLYILQWRDDTDTAGIPPTVSITSPLTGAQVVIGSRINAAVDAADDRGVGLVSLLLNGREVGAAAAPPYQMPIVIPAGGTSATLAAIATDFGGNATPSADVVLSTMPDPLTTISGTVKTQQGAAVQGAVVVAKIPSQPSGVSATTDAAGHYSISNLPTIRGPFAVNATATVNSEPFESNTTFVQPVPGGVAQADLVVINDIPIVTITAPVDGSNVIEGETIRVSVEARAFHPIDSISLLVDGTPYTTAFTNPVQFFFTIPTGPGVTLTFTASAASDVYSGASAPVRLHVIADPRTTLRGTVRKIDGTAVAGAKVNVNALEATTDAAGAYSIAGLPTIDTITATARVSGGLHPLYGRIDVEPVRGGITNGDITVDLLPNGIVSQLDLAGWGNAIAMRGSVAVVAEGANGLQLIDIANIETPVEVGSLSLPGTAIDVRVSGNTAIVAGGSAGVHFVDISDPAHPSLQSTIALTDGARGIAQYGSTLLVASGFGGLHLFDISNPAAPVELSSLTFPQGARSVAAGSGIAIVIEVGIDDPYRDRETFFDVIDLGDPQHPVVLARQRLPGLPRRVALRGGFAYVALRQDGLAIIDLRSPATPSVLDPGSDLSITAMDLVFRGQTIAVAGPNGSYSLGAIGDLSSGSPIPSFTGIGSSMRGQAVALYDAYAVFVEANGLADWVEIGSSRLTIVKYSAQVDTAGHAPSVSITSPAPNSSAVRGDAIHVHVNATDDVGIASVTLTADGRPLETQTKAPFDFDVTAPPSGATLTFGAIATDFGEATAQAANVVVNLIPDPLTTVTGVVRDPQGVPVAGAYVECRGVRGRSDASGNFSLPGVTTTRGDITVTAAARIADVGHAAFSIPKPPVRGGTTNVGGVLVAPLLLTALSSVTIPGYANGVATRTDLAAVAAGAEGLQLVDLNNPYALYVVGSLAIDNAVAVTLDGTMAYVVSSDHLSIVDVADPAHPVLRSTLALAGNASGIAVGGGRAYIVDPGAGMFIVDVSTPAAPVLLKTVAVAGGVAVALYNAHAIVLSWDTCCSSVIDVVPVADPATAAVVTTLPLYGYAQSLAISGSFAYAASHYGGTAIIDLSQLPDAVLIGTYADEFSHTDIAVDLGLLVIGHEQDNPPNLLRTIDVTAPATPALVRSIDFAPLAQYATTSVAVARELVITTAVKDATTGFGSTGTSRLFIGKYRTAPATQGTP